MYAIFEVFCFRNSHWKSLFPSDRLNNPPFHQHISADSSCRLPTIQLSCDHTDFAFFGATILS
jgi:hypothetical protein